jgi:hypothetical protein
MGWGGMEWIDLTHDMDQLGGGALYEHGNKLSGSINVGKFLSSCTTGGFSRRAQFLGVRA